MSRPVRKNWMPPEQLVPVPDPSQSITIALDALSKLNLRLSHDFNHDVDITKSLDYQLRNNLLSTDAVARQSLGGQANRWAGWGE